MPKLILTGNKLTPGVKGVDKMNLAVSGSITTMGGIGNSTTIDYDVKIPGGSNMILYTSPTNPSITITDGTEMTVESMADLTIKSVLD
tara:strand:+ start:51 stop:314 length:264 start_codon:yes stop_codon:yes gene_type:complete